MWLAFREPCCAVRPYKACNQSIAHISEEIIQKVAFNVCTNFELAYLAHTDWDLSRDCSFAGFEARLPHSYPGVNILVVQPNATQSQICPTTKTISSRSFFVGFTNFATLQF
jgi:hypothetical protein